MSNVLFIAPHPDDETLGCGGTILKYAAKGHKIFWLIATSPENDKEWMSKNDFNLYNSRINDVASCYNFDDVFKLGKEVTKLDNTHIGNLVSEIGGIINGVGAEIIYFPNVNDVHTDHQIIAKAVQSTIKWFRYPTIKKFYMYETLSETDFNRIYEPSFRPNVYNDISGYIENKIKIMQIYDTEMGIFPFPRSRETIESLARLRGSQCGYNFAEAFNLVFMKK